VAQQRRRPERAAQYQTREYRQVQGLLAANVLRLRALRGWTQLAAASACGLGIRHYQMIEHAERNATLTTLARLVQGFQVHPAELFKPLRRSVPK
jgi:transcriptional regulator with XRE-family HTH domain